MHLRWRPRRRCAHLPSDSPSLLAGCARVVVADRAMPRLRSVADARTPTLFALMQIVFAVGVAGRLVEVAFGYVGETHESIFFVAA